MDLIRNSLETVSAMAETYLQDLDRRPDSWVELTSLFDHEGKPNEAARDKLVMSIYNITQNTAMRASPAAARSAQSQGEAVSLSAAPPLYIDAHVVFVANFAGDNYLDGLASLSRLIAYFQETPRFSQHDAPGLAPIVDNLTFEMENLSVIDVSNVMAMLGTRYLPSAFYRMRTLPFTSAAVQSRSYPVIADGLADPGGAG